MLSIRVYRYQKNEVNVSRFNTSNMFGIMIVLHNLRHISHKRRNKFENNYKYKFRLVENNTIATET